MNCLNILYHFEKYFYMIVEGYLTQNFIAFKFQSYENPYFLKVITDTFFAVKKAALH